MGSYLRPIVKTCIATGCVTQAVVELHNRFNEPMGTYCQKHGAVALAAQKAWDEQILTEQITALGKD